MSSIRKRLATTLLGAALLGTAASPATAGDPTSVTADILLARPIGFVGTVVGAAAFVATSPFTFVAGTARDSAQLLVRKPADYTFKRRLGDL